MKWCAKSSSNNLDWTQISCSDIVSQNFENLVWFLLGHIDMENQIFFIAFRDNFDHPKRHSLVIMLTINGSSNIMVNYLKMKYENPTYNTYCCIFTAMTLRLHSHSHDMSLPHYLVQAIRPKGSPGYIFAEIQQVSV